MDLKAGQLRHRITLQSETITRDSYGANTVAWTDIANVWCSLEPLKGREYYDSQQINSEVTTRIRIRWRKDVNPRMRVTYGNRIFLIESVVNVSEANKELQLMCKELVQNA